MIAIFAIQLFSLALNPDWKRMRSAWTSGYHWCILISCKNAVQEVDRNLMEFYSVVGAHLTAQCVNWYSFRDM